MSSVPERSEIDEAYTWELESLFADDDAWEEAFERAEELISRAFNQGYRNQNSYNQWGLLLELRGERQQALAKYVEGIEWGERNDEPIGRVRQNLNRALAQDSPTPLVQWLAPVQPDLEIPPWRTLGEPGDTGTARASSNV